MACGCGGGCTGVVRSALIQACVVAFVGILVGALHSSRVPVQLRVDDSKLVTTTIPLPAKPDSKIASSGTPSIDRAAVTPPASGSTASSPPASVAGAQTVTLGLEITVDQAFALFQMGTPFLDARHDAEFNAGHVTNAIRMTSDEFLPRAGEVMGFMPGPVVIYCTGGDCDASHNLAKVLQQAGFTQLHIMKDGYPAWAAAHPELVVKP